MRYVKHAVAAILISVMLLAAKTLIAEQPILIEPENPPEVITVQIDTDFSLTLQGKGWYLARYDRTMLSFKIRKLDAASTTFVMHSNERGAAQLIISRKKIDIPLIVVIVDEVEAIEERAPISKDEDRAETHEIDAEPHTSVSDRAEALRERGLVQEQVPVEQVVNDNQNTEKRERKEEAVVTLEARESEEEKKEVEEKRASTPSVRQENPALPKAEDDAIYYVSDDNRIVKVPRVQEEDYYKRGRRYYQKREYDRAQQELQLYMGNCEKCTRMDSTRLMLADMLLQRGDEEGALVQLNELIESGGEKAVLSALQIRAPLYHSAEQYEYALADYEEIYSRGSGGGEVVLILGDLNFTLDHNEEALRWYEVGISRGVASDETIYRVASIYDRPGDTRNIEKAYEYYTLITEQYQTSKYYQAALDRVQFFESHFFDYH
jgi:tetratricopeptide (TPR) repeat protein